MPRARLVAPFLAFALVLAACGDDDDNNDVGADVGADAGADVDLDGIDPNDIGDDLLGAIDPEGDLGDAISALGLDTRLEAALSGLGSEGEVELESDTEATITFADRSIDEGATDCVVIGVIVEDGETVNLVYTDGEQTC